MQSEGVLNTWSLSFSDVINKHRKRVGNNYFQALLVERISTFIKKGYTPLLLQRSVCLVVIHLTGDNRALLFSCTATGRT